MKVNKYKLTWERKDCREIKDESQEAITGFHNKDDDPGKSTFSAAMEVERLKEVRK